MKILVTADCHYFKNTIPKGTILDVLYDLGNCYHAKYNDDFIYVPKAKTSVVEETQETLPVDLQVFSTPDETVTVENYHKELRENGQEHLILRPASEHYHTGNIDVWKFADENFSLDEVTGFHRIDAIKYLVRYGKKDGYNRKDLEKARVEIDKLLELHDNHRK